MDTNIYICNFSELLKVLIYLQVPSLETKIPYRKSRQKFFICFQSYLILCWEFFTVLLAFCCFVLYTHRHTHTHTHMHVHTNAHTTYRCQIYLNFFCISSYSQLEYWYELCNLLSLERKISFPHFSKVYYLTNCTFSNQKLNTNSVSSLK